MAGAVIDRVWRDSSAESIEADLSSLWMEVGRSGAIARAMMSNLIVVRGGRDADDETSDKRAGGVSIDDVAGRHPSRVIIIDHAPSELEGQGSIAVRAGIASFGPPHARYGVEQIAVRSTCADASLPSLVRRFVRGSLPVSVWCREDLSTLPAIPAVSAIGRQLVYDSRNWRDVRRGVLAMRQWLELDLADLNWRRLAPVRRAAAFGASWTRTESWHPRAVHISHQKGDDAMAWLLAGWLASRLAWAPDDWPDIVESVSDDAVVALEVGGANDAVHVKLENRRAVVGHGANRPSMIAAPEEGEADAVAAELNTLSPDVCLHDALSAILRRLAAA